MPKVTLEPFDQGRDFERFLGWLAQPHVTKWWGDPGRALQHARECAPGSHALIVVDSAPVGYLCWQALPKEGLEAAKLILPSGVMDVDILIGDTDWLGRGVGSRALALLLARLRSDPSVAFAGVGTSVSNTRAIRCFERTGFRLHQEFQDRDWGRCQYLLADVRGSAPAERAARGEG